MKKIIASFMPLVVAVLLSAVCFCMAMISAAFLMPGNTRASENDCVSPKETVSCNQIRLSDERVYRDLDYSAINDLDICDISTSITDCKITAKTMDEMEEMEEKPRADLLGFVYSSISGNIVSGAIFHVFNSDYSFYGLTDTNGLIAFLDIPAGCYRVSVESGTESAMIDNLTIFAGVGKNYINLGLTDTNTMIGHLENRDFDNDPIVYSQRQHLNRAQIHPVYPCPTVNISYNNSIYSMDMKSYVYHVVAAELNSDYYFNPLTKQQKITALEALSVAVRGFTLYQLGGFSSVMPHNGEYMCDSPDCCQSFNPNYSNEYTVTAVDNCNGVIPVDSSTYQPFWAKYFSVCDGNTRSSTDCPNNLISVTCNLHQAVPAGPNHDMVGMCQAGMCKMAQAGNTYSEILAHYYSNMVLWTYLDAVEISIAPGETKVPPGSNQFCFYAASSDYYTFNLDGSFSNDLYLEIYDDDSFYHEYTSSLTYAYDTIYLSQGLYHIYVEADLFGVDYEVNCPMAILANGPDYRNYIYSCQSKVFEFEPTQTGYYTINTEEWIDNDIDTALEVLTSNGSTLYYNDDNDTDYYSHLYVYLSSGTTYYIRVSSYDEDENISCRLLVYEGIYHYDE